MFAKLIIVLLSLVVSAGLTIWAMICGWGLSPKSWGVIVWAVILQYVLAVIISATNQK